MKKKKTCERSKIQLEFASRFFCAAPRCAWDVKSMSQKAGPDSTCIGRDPSFSSCRGTSVSRNCMDMTQSPGPVKLPFVISKFG